MLSLNVSKEQSMFLVLAMKNKHQADNLKDKNFRHMLLMQV
jgi:hypothetical protein